MTRPFHKFTPRCIMISGGERYVAGVVWRHRGVSETAYLIVMVGIILAVAVASVPWLFRKRCPDCGAWTELEARNCRKCPHIFPEDSP